MRVVVNQLVALRQKTGIGHYTAQLLRCLQEQAGEDEIDAFPTGWLARLTQGLVPSGAAAKQKQPRLRFRVPRALKETLRRCSQSALSWCFRHDCARRRYDLYHEPNYLPLETNRPTLTTIHDLSVLHHPEWHPGDRAAYFHRRFPNAVKQSLHFLAVSEFTRQEVIRTLGVSAARVTRVYNGIRPELRPLARTEVAAALQRLKLPQRYLLYVGTIEPRKNLLMLLRAYCSLPGPLRNQWPLLLVGAWGWNARAIAEYFDAVARHRGVVHVGYLSDDDLVTVYNGARALVYPSLYEGFGLPPVEMMACGGAVLASTAGALVETVGTRADLVHALDLDGWYRAILRVLQDDDWWQSLRQDVASVGQTYTWDRCAAETLAVYRSLIGVQRPLQIAA